jgi:hypothetical protein
MKQLLALLLCSVFTVCGFAQTDSITIRKLPPFSLRSPYLYNGQPAEPRRVTALITQSNYTQAKNYLAKSRTQSLLSTIIGLSASAAITISSTREEISTGKLVAGIGALGTALYLNIRSSRNQRAAVRAFNARL